jgi:hypothetical protein
LDRAVVEPGDEETPVWREGNSSGRFRRVHELRQLAVVWIPDLDALSACSGRQQLSVMAERERARRRCRREARPPTPADIPDPHPGRFVPSFGGREQAAVR